MTSAELYTEAYTGNGPLPLDGAVGVGRALVDASARGASRYVVSLSLMCRWAWASSENDVPAVLAPPIRDIEHGATECNFVQPIDALARSRIGTITYADDQKLAHEWKPSGMAVRVGGNVTLRVIDRVIETVRSTKFAKPGLVGFPQSAAAGLGLVAVVLIQ